MVCPLRQELSREHLVLHESERLVRQLRHGAFLRIVVPSMTSDRELLILDDWTRTALLTVLPHSGGATELRGVGHWLCDAGLLVSEPVALLDIYLRRALTTDVCRAIVGQLTKLAGRMKQEALAVAVGHRLFLLRPMRGSVDPPQRQQFLRRTALDSRPTNGVIHMQSDLRTERR